MFFGMPMSCIGVPGWKSCFISIQLPAFVLPESQQVTVYVIGSLRQCTQAEFQTSGSALADINRWRVSEWMEDLPLSRSPSLLSLFKKKKINKKLKKKEILFVMYYITD